MSTRTISMKNLERATNDARRFPESEHFEALRRRAFNEYVRAVQSEPAPAKAPVSRLAQVGEIAADFLILPLGAVALGGIAFIAHAITH